MAVCLSCAVSKHEELLAAIATRYRYTYHLQAINVDEAQAMALLNLWPTVRHYMPNTLFCTTRRPSTWTVKHEAINLYKNFQYLFFTRFP